MLPLHPVVVPLLRPHKAAQAAERLRADEPVGRHQQSGVHDGAGPPGRPAESAAGRGGGGERRPASVGWLEAGVHIKAVADLLGHSSISITGDVCGHTSDDTARGAVDGWSGMLGL